MLNHQSAQACFDTWMNCERILLQATSSKTAFSKQARLVVDDCARICQGTFNAIRIGSENINKLALLCVGICEECAEICDLQTGAGFRDLAISCRECSESVSSLAFPAAVLP